MRKHTEQNEKLEDPYIFQKRQLPNKVPQSPAPNDSFSARQHLTPPALSPATATASNYQCQELASFVQHDW